MAHPVYGLVDLAVFFNEGVGLGDVGFRLIVIVVGDEILHRVAGEKALELAVELGGQGLVGGQHQGGQAHLGHHPGHGEGLARTGHPQKHLAAGSVPEVGRQGPDGLGLIPLGGEFADQVERGGHEP